MTDEELQALRKRIDDGGLAKRRVDLLAEAVAKLNGPDVQQLLIGLSKKCQHPIKYSADDSTTARFEIVCWSNQFELGLAEEIKAAVQQIVERRLLESQQSYANL